MPRQRKGRQKIEIKRITDESSLLVAFSKRHAGVLKKASELCTLCGVEMAIIVFSPNKKVLSFGHPSVQAIVDRFMEHNPSPSSRTSQLVLQYLNAKIQELNTQLTNLLGELEAEKKTRVEELEKLKVAMLELKENCGRQAEKLMGERWLTL
ncbi:hypothetical protein L2E82_32480 [Cichorium intybus]|uniref:Uncharacterized protein n=1 Tax=Cichorium intybus TaxID=13427 RepID=A0ACB9BHC1_CICIN|nr:hypothetical protein L2E82_32480 [Cichorium intybus]